MQRKERNQQTISIPPWTTNLCSMHDYALSHSPSTFYSLFIFSHNFTEMGGEEKLWSEMNMTCYSIVYKEFKALQVEVTWRFFRRNFILLSVVIFFSLMFLIELTVNLAIINNHNNNANARRNRKNWVSSPTDDSDFPSLFTKLLKFCRVRLSSKKWLMKNG